MAQLAICPRCRSTVSPLLGPDGKPLCPACNNTGMVRSQAPQWGAPAAVPGATYYAAPTNADGAVLALVMGILALVIPYIGFIFAFIGLSSAKRALHAIAASAGRLQGQGLAKAGQVMSIIALCIYGFALLLVLVAVLFVLVSNLSKDPGTTEVILQGLARAS